MIRRVMASIDGIRQGFASLLTAPAFEALAPFRSKPAPLSSVMRKTLFFSFCVFLGVFYGFWGTVLPAAFIILLIIPFLFLGLLVLWLLPDTTDAPTRTLKRLLLAFTAVTFLWPNYLAIVLPGLPWLSMRRIVGLIMVAVFLYSLSTSAKMRRDIVDAMNAIPFLWKIIVAFFAVQTVAIIFSVYPVLAYKHWFNSQYAWTTVFFLSVFIFAKPGYLTSWAKLICIAAVVVSLIAIAEQQNKMVLWANHIPPFLKIEDEAVERILTPTYRGNEYRSQAIFGVSLALAEFLALSFTLLLHRFAITRRSGERLLLIAAMVAAIAGIGMSRARVGFMGLIVGIAIYAFIWGYRRYRASRTDVTGAALTYGYPALATAAFVMIMSIDALRLRILGGGGSQVSNDAREIQFDMAPPVIMRSPIFGYGGGRGAEALGFMTPGGQVTIDTYILSIVLDYGIVGFVIFYGAILYAGIVVGFKVLTMPNDAPDRDGEEIGYLFPLSVMLAQFFVIKTVLSQEENHSLLFMIYGAILALFWRLKQREKQGSAGKLASA